MCGIFRRPIWIMWQDIKQCSEDFLGEIGLSRLPLGIKNPKKVDLLALVTIWHAIAWRSWFNHAEVRWGTYCWQAWRSILELVFQGCSTQHWKFPSVKSEQRTGWRQGWLCARVVGEAFTFQLSSPNQGTQWSQVVWRHHFQPEATVQCLWREAKENNALKPVLFADVHIAVETVGTVQVSHFLESVLKCLGKNKPPVLWFFPLVIKLHIVIS